jgi:4-hydroxythreonine-4-phosphate dehydrogenase
MTTAVRPSAVTMGEPAGIGGEIALKAWLGRVRHAIRPFFIIDDADRLSQLAEALGLECPVVAIGRSEEALSRFDDALPVLPQPLAVPAQPGHLNPINGAAVRQSIERAVSLAQSGEAGAVVTNPIHKLGLSKSGFEYPGHTEFLAALAGIKSEPVMMLADPQLRVVATTRHVSVQQAVRSLTTSLIEETAHITDAALRRDFGLERPRLAISALNPHAGEGGLMGKEEHDIIEPAIERLRAEGLNVTGPHPADTLFHARARANYDAALCMYHDQALIPIKTIAFDSAVNVTLGLPFVRTSPDHGTALDIAGHGTADESSLVSALKMAGDMAYHRARWDERHPH